MNTPHRNYPHRLRLLFNRISIFALLVLIFSCETEAVDTLENAHIDPDFVSFFSKTMELNHNSILTFKKGDENLLRLKEAVENSDIEVIASIFNFKSSNEMLAQATYMHTSLQKFIEKFPSLKLNNTINSIELRKIVKRHLLENPTTYWSSQSPTSARTSYMDACNVTVCTRQYSDCRMSASADLAVASSQCLGFGVIVPGFYTYCQGTALLSYSADMSGCNGDFDKCCPGM